MEFKLTLSIIAVVILFIIFGIAYVISISRNVREIEYLSKVEYLVYLGSNLVNTTPDKNISVRISKKINYAVKDYRLGLNLLKKR